MKNIAIYGVGAFGYAILKHLDNKQDSTLQLIGYDHLPEVAESLTTKRTHPFFHTTTSISESPVFVTTPEELLRDAAIVVLAVSSDSSRDVARTIKAHARPGVIIVNIAKALDKKTGKRISEVIAEELASFDYRYAALAGGTTADDFFHHEPLGVDIASPDKATGNELKQLFTSDNLDITTTDDLLGVEYASALKNVVSILAGIVHGLGFSYGSETHIISVTAGSIGRVCVEQLGAQPETFSIASQSWGNDMWMSCTGNTRNRAFGELLGKGKPANEALAEMRKDRKLVEGVNTLQIIDQLPALKEITAIQLLHELIIDQTIDITTIKNHLLKTS